MVHVFFLFDQVFEEIDLLFVELNRLFLEIGLVPFRKGLKEVGFVFYQAMAVVFSNQV